MKYTLILSTILLFNNFAVAASEGWTEVVATTLLEDQQSPSYRDILVHNPGTYSEVKVRVGSDAQMDRFDIISFFLWGTRVSGMAENLNAGEEYTGSFRTSKVKFVRMYIRSRQPGMALPVRVWMR